MKHTVGNAAKKLDDRITIARRDTPPKGNAARSLWADLERAGLGKIAMREQISAHRAILNASSGARTVKRKPEDKAVTKIQDALKSIIASAD